MSTLENDWIEGPMVLTTESRASLWMRLMLPVTLYVGGIIPSDLFMFFADRQRSDLEIAGIVAVNAVLLAATYFIVFGGERGTWVLDREGMAFKPCSGPGRYLRWADVERVRLSMLIRGITGRYSFHGDTGSITIPSMWFPHVESKRCRAFIVESLSGEFDLRHDPLSEWPGRPFGSLRSGAIWICLAVLVLILWTCILGLTFRYTDLFRVSELACGGVYSFGMMFSLKWLNDLVSARELRRNFPEWPWRGRGQYYTDVNETS